MDLLLQACARGLVLYSGSDGGVHPLDFVVSGGSKTIAMTTHWWQMDWSNGQGLIVLDGAVVANSAYSWTLKPEHPAKLCFTPPDEQSDWDIINNGRTSQDLLRTTYVQKLERLEKRLDPELLPMFAQWRDYIAGLPPLTTSAIATPTRKTLCIQLKDPATDRVVDVVAFDELHAAVTVNEVPWAVSVVSAWWDKNCPPGNIDKLGESLAAKRPFQLYFGETFSAVSNLPLDALARSHL